MSGSISRLYVCLQEAKQSREGGNARVQERATQATRERSTRGWWAAAVLSCSRIFRGRPLPIFFFHCEGALFTSRPRALCSSSVTGFALTYSVFDNGYVIVVDEAMSSGGTSGKATGRPA